LRHELKILLFVILYLMEVDGPLGVVVHAYNLIWKDHGSKVGPVKKQETIFEKQLKQKRAAGVAQVVEHLPSKGKA
jgi:hypothetical protein